MTYEKAHKTLSSKKKKLIKSFLEALNVFLCDWKTTVWYWYSCIALCHPSADPQDWIYTASMHLLSSQYLHAQHLHHEATKCRAFPSVRRSCSVLRCPQAEKPSVLQGTCLSPSSVFSLPKMATRIFKNTYG